MRGEKNGNFDWGKDVKGKVRHKSAENKRRTGVEKPGKWP